MADLEKMNRTWLCTVLFMDIVNYSSQSVELQIKWKERFNGYLASAIKTVLEDERVILDTGDGAAVCFLGAPETAMFTALELWHSLLLDEREQQPPFRVRIGINLGPVKLVRDINGAPNAIGDGMNAGQRVMSFAAENQILVSQSYFEVVSRLSDDYKNLFTLKGVETDKHIREHVVYHLSPPGVEQSHLPASLDKASKPASPVLATNKPRASRSATLLVGAIAVAVVAAAGAWYFLRPSAPAPAAPSAAGPPQPAVVTASNDVPPKAAEAAAPIASVPKKVPPARPAVTPVTPAANAAFEDGKRLINEDNPGEAVHRFDAAIRAQPDFVDAYVQRAEARRMLRQYELSLDDCNKVIQIQPDDPRGYNCRGLGRQQLNRYDASLADFSEAIRRNPNFALAYGNRGTSYNLLQQHDRALQDFNQAIRLTPRNPLFHIRRGNTYSDLRQYDKAIQDYTEVIRLEPNNKNAYRFRAQAEQALGDSAGAAADRAHLREARQARNK